MSGVAFSLGKSKKKKKGTITAAVASEFDSADAGQKKSKPPNKTLVIPLPESSSNRDGPLLARGKNVAPKVEKSGSKNDTDKAAEALVRDAEQHFAQKETTEGMTDFSASGSLVIQAKSNTFENDKETDQFRQDLESRADDIAVESGVYDNVRIVDFGAAMLRGMGWKGDNSSNSNTKDADMSMPRPHRLGLGATPKLPTANTNKLRRPDQVKRDEMRAQQHEEYRAKREEQRKLDKQVTLQIGSVVDCNGRRAKMIQLQGVPGLNQVRVQYEGEAEAVSVKKSFIRLIDRDELNEKPFHEISIKEKKPKENDRREKGRDSRPRDKGESRDRYKDKRDREDRRKNDEYRDRRSSDSSRKDERRSKRRSRSREREPSLRDKKRRKEERSGEKPQSDPSRHWLIPNILVRVVSKKFGSRMYKEKGVVLDITPGGGAATLQMENGQVLEHVSERHLETALPKPGGNAICLVGNHKFAKGKLLERDSNKGVIQVFEDMSVLTLALDDVAQWCGPLDDDLEL